jgi:hypothetical protein
MEEFDQFVIYHEMKKVNYVFLLYRINISENCTLYFIFHLNYLVKFVYPEGLFPKYYFKNAVSRRRYYSWKFFRS